MRHVCWIIFEAARNGYDRFMALLGVVHNWLRVFRKLELSAKPHEHWI